VQHVIQVTSTRVAEMVKLLENTFRAVNIGLVNELALMCHKMDIDVWEVIDAAKTKPFGFMPFYPGPGLGGHCIPIDPFYLSWKARQSGFECRFIELAGQVNGAMPEYVVQLIGEALNSTRKALSRQGATVSYTDPYVASLVHGVETLHSMTTADALAKKADCYVVCTNHDAFDYDAIVKGAALIVDTRNALKSHAGVSIFRL